MHVITGLAQQRARAVGMPLHRLGVNQCHFGGLVSQHLRKLAHHTFAYAHIVWFDGGSGDVDDTLIDHFHQLSRGHLRGLSVGAHLHIGHASEHRVAFLVQLLPTLVGVAVEHRTAAAAVGAFHGFLRISHQIHDLAAVGDVFGEPLLDGRGHWSAPAQGEDAVEILQHVKHNVAFQLTELRFAVPFEIFGNLHSRVMFDLVVGVGERQLHHLRHFLADAGLARAHHADDDVDGSTHSSHRIGHLMCSGQDAT